MSHQCRLIILKGKHRKLLSVFTAEDNRLSSALVICSCASKRDARAMMTFQSRETNIVIKYSGIALRDKFILLVHESLLVATEMHARAITL